MVITYEELKKCWIKGFRNGNIRKLDRLQKALYRACLVYARKVGKVINDFLIAQLKPLIERLKFTFRLEASKAGVKKARKMLLSPLIKWVPQVRVWIREQSYIIWLGLMELNSPRVFV